MRLLLALLLVLLFVSNGVIAGRRRKGKKPKVSCGYGKLLSFITSRDLSTRSNRIAIGIVSYANLSFYFINKHSDISI